MLVNKLLDNNALTESSILIKYGTFGQPVVSYLCNSRIQVALSHCECTGAALAFPKTHPMDIDLQIYKQGP
jgi:hypothetical protein